MFIWSVLAAKGFEVGMTVIDDVTGTIGQFFRTTIFGEETYQAEDENVIAITLRDNSDAMQYFAEAQMQLAERIPKMQKMLFQQASYLCMLIG